MFDMNGCGQLYNLADDPAEIVSLFDSSESRDVRLGLVEELLTWTLRAQDPLPLPGGYNERKNHSGYYWTPER